MARTEARLKCSVWDDQDYRSLTLEAQWLYEAILSQKDLSLCGVLTWTPKRFAKLASNANATATRKALELLREKRYVVLDESTDELWVRTLIKNDGVLTNNNSIIGMSRSFEAIHSNPIREGIVASVADQLAQGGTEGGTPTGLVEGLPEGIRKRVGKVFANALALACTRAPARPPVPPASSHPPPASSLPVASADAERQPARPPDRLWDSMLAACGVEGQPTASARGAYNRARKDLAEVGATPEEVHRRADILRAKWPDVDLTPSSLARHWAEAAHPPARMPNGTHPQNQGQAALAEYRRLRDVGA